MVHGNPNDQIFNDDVVKEIEYVLRYWKLPAEEIRRRREEAIDATGIRPYLETHPFDIPLPIRKFLTIAVIAAVSPDYVIPDEPAAGQDLWGCAQLKTVMDYLQDKGKAVLTISHDMEYVAENFDRISVMAHKNVIAGGSCLTKKSCNLSRYRINYLICQNCQSVAYRDGVVGKRTLLFPGQPHLCKSPLDERQNDREEHRRRLCVGQTVK